MIPDLKNKRIGVIAGGTSSEREVSLRSGQRVLDALHKLGYNACLVDPVPPFELDASIDIAFIALHGMPGEDGSIQGYLEMKGIPYTGSRVFASAAGMNKVASKLFMSMLNIPTPDYCLLNNLPKTLSFPVIVKPISDGSSVNVTICHSQAELDRVIAAISAPSDYFIEQYITGKEITIGLIESQPGQFTALPILELRPVTSSFYDYHAKYTEGGTEFILPAQISEPLTQTCQSLAIRLASGLSCSGFARVDMLIDANDQPYVLEINTIPGLTTLSDLPAQADAAGMTYEALIDSILKTAK